MSRFYVLAATIFLIAGVTSRSVEETAHDVIETLAQTPYAEWSPAFLSTNSLLRGEVLPSTLFVPISETSVYHGGDWRKVAAYHVVPEKMDFAVLLSKKDGSLIPTLLVGQSIRVVNSSSGFCLDGVKVVEPDVYVDALVAIHRVEAPFDFTSHGGDHRDSFDWKGWTIILTSFAVLCSAVAYWVNRT